MPYQIITTVKSEDTQYQNLLVDDLALNNADDDKVGLVVTGAGLAVEGRENVYSLKLQSQPKNEIRVIVTPANDQIRLNDELIGEPHTLTFTPDNWNLDQTVRATALDDSVVEYLHESEITFEIETGKSLDFESSTDNSLAENAIALGTILGGYSWTNLAIADADDVDWFEFDLADTGNDLDFARIDFDGTQGNLKLELYSAADLDNPLKISETEDSGQNFEEISLNGQPFGKYYVKVSGDPNNYELLIADEDYQYVRAIPEPLPVIIEDNDLPTVKITAGETASEVFGKPSYFTFQLDAPIPDNEQELKVNYRVIGGSATLDKVVDGERQLGDYRMQTEGFVTIAPGDIQNNLIVVPIDDKLTEDLDLTVKEVKSVNESQLVLTVTTPLPIEKAAKSTGEGQSEDLPAKNNTSGVLIAGDSVVGQIGNNEDRDRDLDRFKVELEAGKEYIFDLEGSPTNGGTLSDTYFRLYDSKGTLVGRNDDGGESLNSRLVFTPETAGNYYAEAGAYSDRTGSYKLTLTGETNSSIPNDISLSKGTEIKFAKDLIGTVQGSPKLTKGSRFYEGEITLTIDDPSRISQIVSNSQAKIAEETVIVELLKGDGYKLPENTQAILRIKDDDVPGVRIVQIGDNTTVEESETASFQVSLLSEPTQEVKIRLTPGAEIDFVEPINPTTVKVEKDVYSFDKSNAGILDVQLGSLVETERGKTVAFEVNLQQEPSSDFTVELYDANNPEPEPELKPEATLTFTKVEENLVLGEQPGNWNKPQQVVIGNLDFNENNQLSLKAVVKNQAGEQISEIDLPINHTVEQVEKQTTEITIPPEEWYQLKTVPITGVNDGISEPGIYHESNITYEVSSSDSDYNNIFVPQQRIDVVDPILNAESTAQTIQQGFTGLQNSLDSLEVPLVGSLEGKSPKLIKDVSDNLVTAISGSQNLSAIRLKKVIEDALGAIGLDFLNVSVDISQDDINIALNIKKTYNLFSLPLDADLGLDALGISFKSEGEIKSTFEMEVALGFGLHKDFGFYMDTDETKVEAAIKLGLDKFKGQGNLNVLRLDIEDDLTNKTELEISLKAGLNDLDNYQTLKFFDVDGDGQLDAKTFTYPIRDDKKGNAGTTENREIQEPFVEVNAKGKAADFPTVAEASAEAKRVNWNGNSSFDEPKYEKNEGVYRTYKNKQGNTEYYFDLNRNGRLDSSNQEKLLSVSKQGNAEKKWFDKQGKIKPFRIEEKTENKTKIYYFDKNGNNQPDESEKLTKKQKSKLDKNNNGKLDADVKIEGEGKFVWGTGIAFADANNNKKFDLGEEYVNSQFDELTLESDNLSLSFLDLNGDKELLIKEAIDEKTNDSFLYLDLTGDGEFSEQYINDGDKTPDEPKISEDADGGYLFLDLNGDGKQNIQKEPLVNEVANKDAFLDIDFNGDRNFVYEPVINQAKDYLTFEDKNDDNKQEKIIDYDRNGIEDDEDRDTNAAVQTGTYPNGSSFEYLDTSGDGYWTQEHQIIKEGGENYLDLNNDGKKDDGDRKIIDVDLDKVRENDNKDLIYLDENNNNQRDDKELLLLDKFTGRIVQDLNDNSEIDDDEPAIDVRLDGNKLKSIEIKSTTINYSGNDPVLSNLNGKQIKYLDESQDDKFTREYQVLTDDTNNNNYGKVLDENGNNEVDFSDENTNSNDPLIIFNDAIVREDKSLSLDFTKGFVESSQYLDYNNNGEFDEESSDRSIKEYKIVKDSNGKYRRDRNNNGTADNNEPVVNLVEALDLDDNQQFTDGSDLIVGEKEEGETTLKFNDRNGNGTQDNEEPFIFNKITFLDIDGNGKLTVNQENTSDDFIVNKTYLDLNSNSINDPGEPQLKDDDWVIDEDYVVTYKIVKDNTRTFIDQFQEDSLNKNNPTAAGKGTYQESDDIDLNKSFNVSNFQAQILGLPKGGTYTAANLLGLNTANGEIIDSEITFVDLENDGKLDISVDPIVKIVDGVRFVDLDGNGSVTLNDDEPVELVSAPNNKFDTKSLKGKGEIVTLLDDGSRLTLKELQNFKNDEDLKFLDLFGYEFAGTANLGLVTKTSIEGNPAFPSIGFNLGVGLPLFNYGNQEQAGDNGLTIEFKDMKLDLGTFLTEFVTPIIKTADEILSYTKPVVDLLNKDTKLFSYIGLEDTFNKDSRPGVSILDIGMTLAEGISEDTTNPRLKKIKDSIPKAVKFVNTVTQITELSASLKKLTESNQPIVLDFGDYTLSDFKAASDDPADVSSKAGSGNKTTTQVPGGETKTPVEQAQDKATPEQKGTLSKLRNLDGLEIPILDNPITLIKLLLGESNVDLIKYDIPDLEFAFSKEQQFPIWTPPNIAGVLELGFEAKTDLSIGYDTGGYEAWQKTDYELAQVYQLLDGFYLDDWDDDGNEKDELSATATIAAGLSASVAVAKAVVKGGVDGTLGFDIVDTGELQGKNDGKIRGSEIITRLDTPLELFDFKGQLDAFLSGEIRIGLDVGFFEIMKTVWSQELGRITIAKFNVGANGVTFSSSISGSYINAATVFFDGNFNDVWDEGEPITFTNEYGQYDLEIGLDWDSNEDGTIDELDGQIISVGGYDTSSGLPAGKFIGFPNSTIITPLTSLQVPLVQSGLTGEEADTLIKQQLGLDPNIDLETFDSLHAVGQQEELGLDIYLAHISIQAIFNQSRALLDGLQGDSADPNNLQIVQETFARFLQNRAESTTEAYNLGNIEDVTTFLNFLAAENDVVLTSQQLETIASFIAQSDRILQEVAEVGASKSMLETLPALASVKRAVQGDIAQLIGQLTSDSESIDDIVTKLENTIYQNYIFADEDINAFGNRSVKVTAQKDTIDEADATTEFIVELSQPAPNQGLTVLYSISGTATLGEDYQTTEDERTVYIAPGETTAKIAVSISEDFIDESTENITVNLQSVGEGYILDPLASIALLQITDNDESADVAIEEGKTLIGSLDDDVLNGSAGEDRLEGGYGNDTLQGKQGNDFIQGSQGQDLVIGGLDDDTLEGNFDDDTLEGNAGNDILDGGAGNDSLEGNEGIDAIAGGTEDDILDGGAGNDLLEGDTGNDILHGGSDNDWLVGDAGNDILDGGLGDDVLSGGEDADVFFFNSADEGFDSLIDFDPSQGDKIQISAAGFGVENIEDFRFISGILDFQGQDLALIQNRGTTYSYFPNLDDIIEVVERPTQLVNNTDVPELDLPQPTLEPAIQPLRANTVEHPELTILDDILQRGSIKLGISPTNSQFDLEFTRTLAAAIFGDASKIETVDSSFSEAFQLVADGTVDLASRRYTHTSQRDGNLNIDFSPAYFYDSQGIIVSNDSGIKSISDIQGRTVGVVAGSTSLNNLKNELNPQGIEFTSQSFATVEEMVAAYDRSEVDAYSTDRALIVENLDRLSDPENHHLLDIELSKEPIALALPENDSQWSDIVRWVNYVPIQAEEFGISSENIAEIVAANTDDNSNNDSDPEIRRFLGIEGKLGAALGLNNDFAVKVIEQVGNYGEIYDRHFSEIDRDRNLLYDRGGLFYSLPFSGSEINAELIDNNDRDLLADIRSRGYIKLGLPKNNNPGFSTKKGDEYAGFDVDLGLAIAAALFGDSSKVEIEVQSFRDSFANTANGVVDLSAMGITHNLVRDASMGVDFSLTYLYTGQGVLVRNDSGIDLLPSLNGRRVGAVEGTTSIQNLQDSLSEFGATAIPAIFAESEDMFAAYERGEIDAVTTDIPILSGRIPTLSNPEEHQLLDKVLSKEPLALITDENQSEWKDIVNWVQNSLVQAEELNITSENIDELIAVNTDDRADNDSNDYVRNFLGIEGNVGEALGLSNDFTVNVIKAVGNYGEIYERNFGSNTIPRGENQLYTDFGLQYSLPFTNSLTATENVVGEAVYGNVNSQENLGNDSLEGGFDSDTLSGGSGNDTIKGHQGSDILSGGEGEDILEGGDGIDSLEGGMGADTLSGGEGEDILEGGDGIDSLEGGMGADTLSGGEGEDTFAGNLLELDGDTIADFTAEDTIAIDDVGLTNDNLTVTQNSAMLNMDIDIDLNGTVDSTIVLEGDFANMQFAVESNTLEDFTTTSITVDNSEAPNQTEEGSTVYRFFNPSTGTHFYTADENESNYVKNSLDNYDYEGQSYIAVNPLNENSEEVYRFFNSTTGSHFYTTDENERDYIISNLDNFAHEDVKFHAYGTQVIGSIPIYRFYESTQGAHFYTPNEGEKAYIEDHLSDYTYEGIAYYAFPIDNI